MSETGLVFLLAYAFGLGLAIFGRPMYGLYTYVAVFYIHPPSRWWGATLPDLRWSLLAAAVTLVAILIHWSTLKHRSAWYQSRVVAFLLAYTVWMWLQIAWVESPSHLEGTILFTKYVFLAALIFSIIDNEKDLCGFCLAHVIGCAYLGFLVYLAPDTGRLEGVGGPGIDDANSLGMHLATGLVFAGFLLLLVKGWKRWFVLATIPLILNGLIQTETRGALVGLFLGGLATFYLKPREYRKTYYVLTVCAIAGFLFIANEAFLERMQTLRAAVNDEHVWDNSAMSRIAIVNAQLEMFVDNPLGVGHQGTAYLSRQYLEEHWLATNSGDRASHNTVMSVLVDQGVPGIIIFTLLAATIFVALRRLKIMDKTGLAVRYGIYRAMLGGALVTIFGAGMFAQNLKAEVQIWCLALIAILWELVRQEHMPIISTTNGETRLKKVYSGITARATQRKHN